MSLSKLFFLKWVTIEVLLSPNSRTISFPTFPAFLLRSLRKLESEQHRGHVTLQKRVRGEMERGQKKGWRAGVENREGERGKVERSGGEEAKLRHGG